MSSVIRRPKIKGGKRLVGVDSKPASLTEFEPSGSNSNVTEDLKRQHDEIESLAVEVVRLREELERQSEREVILKQNSVELELKLSSVSTELGQIKKDNSKVGYTEGWAAAELDCEQKYQSKLRASESKMLKSIEALQSVASANWECVTETAAEIGFEVACKVIGKEYCQSAGLLSFIKNALRELTPEQRLTIKALPSDIARLQGEEDVLKSACGFALSFLPDSTIEHGGIIAEFSGGQWDARLDRQLIKLKNALEGVIEKDELKNGRNS